MYSYKKTHVLQTIEDSRAPGSSPLAESTLVWSLTIPTSLLLPDSGGFSTDQQIIANGSSTGLERADGEGRSVSI